MHCPGNELGVNTSQVAIASPLPPYSTANIYSRLFSAFWTLQCWLFSLLCLVALTLYSPRHSSGWEDLVLETRLFRKPWAGTVLDYLLLAQAENRNWGIGKVPRYWASYPDKSPESHSSLQKFQEKAGGLGLPKMTFYILTRRMLLPEASEGQLASLPAASLGCVCMCACVVYTSVWLRRPKVNGGFLP